MAEVARKASLSIAYNNVDISEDIAKYLVFFEYVDSNEQLDSVTLRLENADQRWLNDWLPDKSATLDIKINYEGGVLNCGRFSVDRFSASSKPSVAVIKAISIDVNSTLQEQRKTKSFEDVTLKEIAEEVTGNAGFEVGFFADDTEAFKRLDQQEESDLSFLQRICKSYNLQIKVKNGQVVIWSVDRFLESRAINPNLNVLKWDVSTKTKETYSECTVSYFDQASNTTFKHTARDSSVTVQRALSIKRKVSSPADAQRVAESSLSSANKLTSEIAIDCMGETLIVSGAAINLDFLGKLSGAYLIRSSKHVIDRSNGYKTSFKAAKK